MNLTDVLPWWQWLVGALGLAAAAAAIVLAVFGGPALARVVGKTLAGWLGELLATRIGALLVVGLCCWFASALITGHQAALTCEAKVARMKADAVVARKARDDEIAAEISKKYEFEIAALRAREADLLQRVKDNAQKPDAIAGCKLSPRALRLRDQAK